MSSVEVGASVWLVVGRFDSSDGVIEGNSVSTVDDIGEELGTGAEVPQEEQKSSIQTAVPMAKYGLIKDLLDLSCDTVSS